MKDNENTIIYVGKAKNLKNRVSSYFAVNLNRHEKKVSKMIENVNTFDYIVTDSEFEALILECSLIKKHRPKYNILLKDSKGYNYIKITHDVWPMVSYVKQKLDDKATYIGPYISNFSVRNTVKEILNIFKLPKCKRDLNKIYNSPCLYFYIKKCCAPCIRKINHEEYVDLIEEVKHFLQNGVNDSIKILTNKMKTASENLDFESAAKYRDKIQSLKNINSKQKVVSSEIKNQDVIAIAENKQHVSIEVFRFKDGDLYESKNFILNHQDNTDEIRTEFLKQFYSSTDTIPEYILVDGSINDKILISKMLSKQSGNKIKISMPKTGESLRLMNMCRSNAYESLLKENSFQTKNELYLEDLKNTLKLDVFPSRIEAYDISNLSGTNCVGAMIVFKEGKPFKQDYRKFHIGYLQDDYQSMREVFRRRFTHSRTPNDKSFSTTPDLILIDGGTKHVSVGQAVLKELNLNIPIFGMVKDKKHRTKALTDDTHEIKIKNNSYLYFFITSIQNEVHRFAISYHRKLRNKDLNSSELNSIKGIGNIRAKALLRAFGSIEKISNASLSELENVKGMNRNAAYSVYNYFKF